MSDIKNPFGSTRPEQTISGERHVPIYNTVDMQKISQNQPATQTPQTLPAAAPANQTPYDYYSAATSATVGQMVQQPQTDAGGRTLGTLNPAPVKANPAFSTRKPLLENAYNTQNNTQTSGAYQSASSLQTTSLQTVPAAVSSNAAVAQPVANEAAPSGSSSISSFFSKIFGSSDSKPDADTAPPPWKERDGLEAEGALPESERNAPYTPLSSVPPSPSALKDIKANRDSDIQNLQEDHATAQAQKEALSNEPSGQQKITPVEMPPVAPPAPVAPPVAEAPPESHVSAPPVEPMAASPAIDNPPVAFTAPVASEATPIPEAGPRKPVRGIDIMTQAQWDAMQREKLLRQSMPPEAMQPSAADASIEIAPPSQSQTGLDNVDDKAKDTNPGMAAETAKDPVEQQPSLFQRLFNRTPQTTPQDAAPKDTQQDQTNGDGDVKSLVTPMSSDPNVVDSAAVAPVTSGDTNLTLPPPQMLGEIKMMPQSRYSTRVQDQGDTPAGQ